MDEDSNLVDEDSTKWVVLSEAFVRKSCNFTWAGAYVPLSETRRSLCLWYLELQGNYWCGHFSDPELFYQFIMRPWAKLCSRRVDATRTASSQVGHVGARHGHICIHLRNSCGTMERLRSGTLNGSTCLRKANHKIHLCSGAIGTWN